MDIKTLKAGESGYGYLVEYDSGTISPLDERNKSVIREFKNLDPTAPTQSLVVYVVLQKFGVKNRNGRIYSENILKKQNELYQQSIRERRAIGECVPAGTEIFTVDGWKNIETVVDGGIIYTLNLESNLIEEQPINYTIQKNYNDDLVHIYNKDSLDMVLTKNHKMVLWGENNLNYQLTAIEFYNKIKAGDKNLFNSIIKSSGDELNLSDIKLNDVNVELIPFNDNVYCVNVPNKTWLMRFNGKKAWTHNCDHPESSVISADRVSHNIIETWWEGHTLMGKMEVLMTRGYINFGIVSTKGDMVAELLRHNIMIGVSSRGVGSLKEVKGVFIVQDDFELICWDVVTAPSTPGSWIFKDKSEARPYVESLTIVKPNINEGLDRFLMN